MFPRARSATSVLRDTQQWKIPGSLVLERPSQTSRLKLEPFKLMAVFSLFGFVTWGSYSPPTELMFNREHHGKDWFNVCCLQDVFTVISFDSQNGFWWAQSGYYGFVVEKPQFTEVHHWPEWGGQKWWWENLHLSLLITCPVLSPSFDTQFLKIGRLFHNFCLHFSLLL